MRFLQYCTLTVPELKQQMCGAKIRGTLRASLRVFLRILDTLRAAGLETGGEGMAESTENKWTLAEDTLVRLPSARVHLNMPESMEKRWTLPEDTLVLLSSARVH